LLTKKKKQKESFNNNNNLFIFVEANLKVSLFPVCLSYPVAPKKRTGHPAFKTSWALAG